MCLPREIGLCNSSFNIQVCQCVIQRVTTTHLRHDSREIGSEGRIHEIEEAVLIRFGSKSVVETVELGVVVLEDCWVHQVQVLGFGVNGESGQLGVNGTWLGGVSLRIWPPEEDVFLAQSEVEYDVAGFFFVGVGYVAWE